MSVETIIQSIDLEITNLTQARKVLTGLNGTTAMGKATFGKRIFTAAARRKMAASQKRRWAAYRAAKGKPKASLALVQPKPRRMSSVARKRIAAAQKARWAKFRASKAR